MGENMKFLEVVKGVGVVGMVTSVLLAASTPVTAVLDWARGIVFSLPNYIAVGKLCFKMLVYSGVTFLIGHGLEQLSGDAEPQRAIAQNQAMPVPVNAQHNAPQVDRKLNADQKLRNDQKHAVEQEEYEKKLALLAVQANIDAESVAANQMSAVQNGLHQRAYLPSAHSTTASASASAKSQKANADSTISAANQSDPKLRGPAPPSP